MLIFLERLREICRVLLDERKKKQTKLQNKTGDHTPCYPTMSPYERRTPTLKQALKKQKLKQGTEPN
jgi:hypothetical protein